MTIFEWQSTRKAKLATEEIPYTHFSYADGSHIDILIVANTVVYNVMIGNTETCFDVDKLENAEIYLWNNWSKDHYDTK